MGGLNIYKPPVADPTTGIMYAPHSRVCSAPRFMVPTNGVDEERGLPGRSAEAWRGRERHTPTTGTTVAAWAPGGPAEFPAQIDGLPVYRPLFQGLAAYDMNTGERLWDVPVGETPERFRNHPRLAGLDLPNLGGSGHSIQMVVGDLLVQTTEDLRGEAELGANGLPLPAGPRQADRRDRGQRRGAHPGPVRHDDLPRRRRAVHPHAGRQRTPEAARRARGAAAAG